MQLHIFKTVAEVKEEFPNGYFSTLGEPQGVAFVAVVYKWSYEGNEGVPSFPFAGPFVCIEHHPAEKWDAFVFVTAETAPEYYSGLTGDELRATIGRSRL